METTPLLINRDGSYEEKGVFHPTRALFRYSLLIIISLICFGSYFTYDEIQPSQYRDQFKGYINQGNFGTLYSVYSIPNTVLVFFGGILGDRIGLRLAGLLFVTLCLIGAALVALGSQLIGVSVLTPASGYLLTVLGRIVFGCGAESLNVIQNSMITRWFSGGKELAFAMGLVLSMSRLGDLFALSGTIYPYHWLGNNFNWILWIGVVLCGLSFLSVIIYSVIDKATEKYFPSRQVNLEDNQLNFKAVLHFDVRFWLIAVVCMSYYGGIFPFVAICNNYLIQEYHMGDSEASFLSGVVTLSSMLLSPFLGKFLDIVARRPYFVVFGSMVVIPTHIYLALLWPNPVIPIIFMGLSFSLVPAALWPSIPLVIRPKEVATAFGVMAAIQNSGLAAINAISEVVANSRFGYSGAMWFFVFMDCVGLTFAVILCIVDRAKGGILISPNPVPLFASENQNQKEIQNVATGIAVSTEHEAGQGGIINY